MATFHERFWTNQSFAVVGHSAKKPFPALTYGALKDQGKKVYPVDPSVGEIGGDPVFKDLSTLPDAVQAVVLEVPREETESWVGRAAEAGVKDVWIHMGRDTPGALKLARDKGIEVRTGTCAVMYLKGGYHTIHKWINRCLGKY